MTYLQKKKLAFMSIVNQVKGFVRTVSGIPPLTLPGCVDTESVIDYTIEGASGGVGDVTENLFDNTRNWSGIGNASIPSYGDNFVQKINGGGYHIGGHSSVSFTFNNLVAGETYTLSYCFTTDDKGQTVCCAYTPNVRYDYIYTKGEKKRLSSTFTAGDSGSVTFKFGIANQALGYGHYYGGTITELMLVPGSTAKTYEPYGYKIPIACRDKTLFDESWTNIYLSAPLEDGESINYKEDNLPTLPTLQGTTIYTVETAVQPSNMEVTYYSNQKG